jgi:hypothetical protein
MISPYWPKGYWQVHYWYERYWFGSAIATIRELVHRYYTVIVQNEVSKDVQH